MTLTSWTAFGLIGLIVAGIGALPVAARRLERDEGHVATRPDRDVPALRPGDLPAVPRRPFAARLLAARGNRRAVLPAADHRAAERRIDVPGPVRLSPEGTSVAGSGATTRSPVTDAGPRTAASDPGRWPHASPVTTAPCSTDGISGKGDSPGSEACEACTANQCPPGCQCSCRWGTTADHAWETLTAEPGWGEPDWCGDLDAEAFATDDLLIRAGELLGAGT